nr:hypothetical protein [Tanacetum cinerariifolium]
MIPTKIPIIAPTIPPSPYYMPTSLDYSPTSDTESDPSEDPSSYHIPQLPAIPPFLSSADDTIDNDTLDTPPLPTHAPGQPIAHGRPYRYHLNGPVHMMTARKGVGPLHVEQLAVRHYVDHSLLDYFSPDYSAQDSSSYSSSEASSNFHSDGSSDSSSRHSFLDHSFTNLPSTTVRPSRKRRRSYMTYVPTLPPVSKVLSHVCANLILSHKRVRDSIYWADVEVDPREISLRDDVVIRNALRDRGIDARVVVKAVDREESETEAIPVHRIQVIKRVYREQGRRIVRVESAITALTKRVAELERDNKRLRGITSVETQRMPNTRSGASMTHEEVKELVTRRVAEEIEACEGAMNLEPLNENGDEQEGGNGGNGENGNRGNGGNRNGKNGENRNGNRIGIMA